MPQRDLPRKSRFRTYEEARRYLFEAIDFEKISKYTYDPATFNLKRTFDLCAAVGDPHLAGRHVHVAGTKGKGSTSIMLAEIIIAHGLRVGLFTSPHLVRVEERIRVNGEMISEDDFLAAMNEIGPYVDTVRAHRPKEAPTYWEMLTVIGFLLFREKKTDINIIEVGLGGRLDSTNVIVPRLCVITQIDFDHMDKLGNTIEKIAAEKAGIIKPRIPVVCCRQHHADARDVIERKCSEVGAPLRIAPEPVRITDEPGRVGMRFSLETDRRAYRDLFLPLLGAHQAENAAIAVAAAEELEELGILRVEPDRVRDALSRTVPEARIQVISENPTVLLDCAHNVVSARALGDVIRKHLSGRRLVLILGMSADKDVDGFLREIVPLADRIVTTKADNPRAAEPAYLLGRVKAFTDAECEAASTSAEALRRARAHLGPDDVLCITGSFYLAGEMKALLQAG